jgi:hypothetical protein
MKDELERTWEKATVSSFKIVRKTTKKLISRSELLHLIRTRNLSNTEQGYMFLYLEFHCLNTDWQSFNLSSYVTTPI